MTRPLRVVLDTNVTVSAMLWQGRPGDLIARAGEGDIALYASANLVSELAATLAKPKLESAIAATGCSAKGLISNYRQLVHMVRTKPLMEQVSRDKDDDVILACAVAAKAEYLVSGDKDLLVLGRYEDVAIVTVATFLEMLHTI
jgi:uncharacterized protein